MQRRSFIKGMLIGATVATGEALIKIAEPEEVQALVPQREVVLGQPEPQQFPGSVNWPGTGMVYMQDKNGNFQPVGYITSVSITAPIHDTISWNGDIQFVPGLKRATGTFEGRG